MILFWRRRNREWSEAHGFVRIHACGGKPQNQRTDLGFLLISESGCAILEMEHRPGLAQGIDVF